MLLIHLKRYIYIYKILVNWLHRGFYFWYKECKWGTQCSCIKKFIRKFSLQLKKNKFHTVNIKTTVRNTQTPSLQSTCCGCLIDLITFMKLPLFGYNACFYHTIKKSHVKMYPICSYSIYCQMILKIYTSLVQIILKTQKIKILKSLKLFMCYSALKTWSIC